MKTFSFKPGLHIKGRQFRGLRGFAGKPFHPPLTDIPVGAYTIAPVLDILSFFMGTDSRWGVSFHRAAGYVFVAGAAVSLVTALTGFADWLDTEKGTQMRRMANAHAWTMIVMTLLVLTDLAYRYLLQEAVETDIVLAVLAAAIGGLVTLGSAIGGSLVYDFGFNVESSKDNPAWHQSEQDVMTPNEEES